MITALKLSNKERQTFEDKGIQPHWRFKLDVNKVIEWDDLVKGKQHFEAKNLSDPVLIRANGTPTYMLPSAIDDMDYSISHVVRGEDHVTNTAIQIQLFEAIGSHIPRFAHHSLMKSKGGKISKREGGFDIGALRKEGIEPMAITSFLARLGTSQPIEPRASIDQLVDHFDISTFSRASAIYDYDELERINAKILHLLSFNDVKDRLLTLGLTKLDEPFWESVKPNLRRFGEITEWWEICKETITPVVEDLDFLQTASKLLPDGQWDENTWGKLVEDVKKETGRKGKELFMPLRKALTARESGPELKQLLPLIGSEKAHARLNGEAA